MKKLLVSINLLVAIGLETASLSVQCLAITIMGNTSTHSFCSTERGLLISQAQIQQTEALESTHTVGLKQSRLCMMAKSPTMTLRVKVV